MQRIEKYTDFINEAEEKEVELKVNNSGYTKYLTWFKKNTDLFKAHRSGRSARQIQSITANRLKSWPTKA